MGIPYGISRVCAGWTLPPLAKARILTAVNRDEQTGAEFLKAIERAVISSDLTTQRQESLSRADLKNCLNKPAKAAKDLVDALENIPSAGTYYYQGAFYETVQQARALLASVTNAADQANSELSGRGADRDVAPEWLAANIAQALKTIGIEPSASRPKENFHGEIQASPFWLVAEVCFSLAGFPVKDLRNYLREGLKYNVVKAV